MRALRSYAPEGERACDPDEIDYVIPGNDDAIRAVKLIAATMANAVLESRQGEQNAEEPAETPAEAAAE